MEASMKNRCLLVAGAAVTAILALSSMTALVSAEDGVTHPTNPSFAPNTGQINRGIAQQLSSQSSDVPNMPTPEEARAALMTPVSKQPSTGDALPTTTGTGAPEKQETTNTGAAGKINEPPPSGPIGSFGQTIPAKFSKRNDILDRVPIMALPLPLTDHKRMQILDALMSDASEPVAGADALTPASELSPDQALNGMRPLPESVRSIDGVENLYYLKAK